MRIDYHRPRSLDEAWQLFEEHPGSWYLAGGTDLMVQLRQQSPGPSALISLASIPELTGLDVNGRTRIGALTCIGDLLDSPELSRSFPILVQAAGQLGSVQIRNVATVGGNLCNCSPCADIAPPLLVLGARVELARDGSRRELPLEQLMLGPGETSLAPGEILTGVLVDPPPEHAAGVFVKKGRVRVDLALASAAVLLVMEGDRCRHARIAAGSVAPVPLRLTEAEALLEGSKLSSDLLVEVQAAVMRGVQPISDVRAGADYRRRLVGVQVRRAVAQLAGVEE